MKKEILKETKNEVMEQMFSDHKKQSNKEKDFIKKSQTLFTLHKYFRYSLTVKQRDTIFIENMLNDQMNLCKKESAFYLK